MLDPETFLIRDHEDEADQIEHERAERERIENEQRAREARERMDAFHKREQERKAAKQHLEALRMNDCHDAHDGKHPWALVVELGDVKLECALCQFPYPIPDIREVIDCSIRVTVREEGGGTDYFGEANDFYLHVDAVEAAKAHRHLWYYNPDGSHHCMMFSECDAWHSESCGRPCKNRPDRLKGLSA